jgi:hypothetical protein
MADACKYDLLTKIVNSKGEGKVVSVLFLTQHHAVKAYWEVELQIHSFLTSAIDGGEW